jgi:hypothetical protein
VSLVVNPLSPNPLMTSKRKFFKIGEFDGKWIDRVYYPVRTLKIDPIDRAGEAVGNTPCTPVFPFLKSMNDFFLIN